MYQKSRNYSSRRNNNHHRSSNKRRSNKQFIDPKRFVQKATHQTEKKVVVVNSFSDFNVHPELHKNIQAKGFSTPSPIQDQTIPLALDGHDVFGIANTGTGKTAAFALPILHRLLTNKNSKAIIMAPTRELAGQILDEIRSLGAESSKIYWSLLIGGAPMGRQLRDLSRNPNLVIGTPGRIKDHIQRGSLKLNNFNLVVLDEVDRMLDMGFINDIRFIMHKLSAERQNFFFSATTNKQIELLLGEFAASPRRITTKSGDTSSLVEQDIIKFNSSTDKIDKLHNLLIEESSNKFLIFSETRRDVEKLDSLLKTKGFLADSIHGGKSQGQRRRALANFKDNRTKILVATDVASRGIDIKDITHVVNYSTPQTYDDYVHRVGRAGRAGSQGYAFTFVRS